MDANELRSIFIDFFVERGHTLVPSSGLIPHHPLAPLFTNAGMNQFLPYLLGEETPPYPRATSVQKCVRVRGKHDDIELIGRTTRHLTFFEMLGQWSFGDYFKQGAIEFAWELVTERLGLDGDRVWATVHETDDEAARIWEQEIGLPPERIQRMGADNFWEMGDTGPCGPCSELYYDRGPAYGADGGPAQGGEERYVEFWNLVFMQYDRAADGTLTELPKRNIDTGAGLERMLAVINDVDSVFDTDVLRTIVTAAERMSGRRYGDDAETDVKLRILADHARTVTFLVNDGVFPSNEDRGYVLRRILRRAVLRAFQLGVERPALPPLVEAVVELMDTAYPDLARNKDFVVGVVAREEEKFRQTLKSGSAILDEELARVTADNPVLRGDVAFRLHDTFGFPLELTREIAAERGVQLDEEGFEAAMADQRYRARSARAGAETDGETTEAYRELLEQFGPTEFVGYADYEAKGRILAATGDELILDRTPFYAESGGQVGDTGEISTDTGVFKVTDTTYAIPGQLIRHTGRVTEGEVTAGEEALARIDAGRREAIRRNHTGTHLLHWALREVLGPHVKQQGSLVAPDRLRFDFSHYQPVTHEELAQVEALANARVLANEPVRAYETSKDEAEKTGAIAFFGDKYGDVVRVVEAGTRSVELCGGTHVGALGMIGPIKIVSEGSIAANMRRIEALTGEGSLEHFREDEDLLERTATMLRIRPDELPERIERLLEERRHLDDELKALRRAAAGDAAQDLAAAAVEGVVVARRDGTTRDELKDLAVAVRDRPDIKAVVLGGVPEGGGVALVAAVTKDSGLDAPALIADAARTVGGGGGGKKSDIAVAGGRDASKLDEALDQARKAAGLTK
ncbi:MAG TPA: alanine--tRNA ligase [Acidimicrobiales bacterium]|jgi:alanyl-tRNA synthetase|nr:alanine--tRNA ligase [Acidimicrobiales bacterium]